MLSINEFLVKKHIAKDKKHKFCPKTKEELYKLVHNLVKRRGYECNLNDIDTSYITDMSDLFSDEYGDKRRRNEFTLGSFEGDISEWDVSNVKSMRGMFENSVFNGDISNWDTSSVEDMSFMFKYAEFNGDISKWNTSNVTEAKEMFYCSEFDGDLSKWDMSSCEQMDGMFQKSKFTGKNGDISDWDVSNVKDMISMFNASKYAGDVSKWDVSNVKNMHYMFEDTTNIDCDLSNWPEPKLDYGNLTHLFIGIFKKSSISENHRPKWWLETVKTMK